MIVNNIINLERQLITEMHTRTASVSIHIHILQRHSSIKRCMYTLNYTINICNQLELGTKLACLVSIGM